MENDEFLKIVENRLIVILATLSEKNAEYTLGDNDRFSNFKHSAKIFQCSPEKALINFWVKHVTNVLDMMEELDCKCGEEAYCFPSFNPDKYMKTIKEKIGDIISYMLILEGLLTERYKRNCESNDKIQ